jgi:hypothetical protein
MDVVMAVHAKACAGTVGLDMGSTCDAEVCVANTANAKERQRK